MSLPSFVENKGSIRGKRSRRGKKGLQRRYRFEAILESLEHRITPSSNPYLTDVIGYYWTGKDSSSAADANNWEAYDFSIQSRIAVPPGGPNAYASQVPPNLEFGATLMPPGDRGPYWAVCDYNGTSIGSLTMDIDFTHNNDPYTAPTVVLPSGTTIGSLDLANGRLTGATPGYFITILSPPHILPLANPWTQQIGPGWWGGILGGPPTGIIPGGPVYTTMPGSGWYGEFRIGDALTGHPAALFVDNVIDPETGQLKTTPQSIWNADIKITYASLFYWYGGNNIPVYYDNGVEAVDNQPGATFLAAPGNAENYFGYVGSPPTNPDQVPIFDNYGLFTEAIQWPPGDPPVPTLNLDCVFNNLPAGGSVPVVNFDYGLLALPYGGNSTNTTFNFYQAPTGVIMENPVNFMYTLGGTDRFTGPGQFEMEDGNVTVTHGSVTDIENCLFYSGNIDNYGTINFDNDGSVTWFTGIINGWDVPLGPAPVPIGPQYSYDSTVPPPPPAGQPAPTSPSFLGAYSTTAPAPKPVGGTVNFDGGETLYIGQSGVCDVWAQTVNNYGTAILGVQEPSGDNLQVQMHGPGGTFTLVGWSYAPTSVLRLDQWSTFNNIGSFSISGANPTGVTQMWTYTTYPANPAPPLSSFNNYGLLQKWDGGVCTMSVAAFHNAGVLTVLGGELQIPWLTNLDGGKTTVETGGWLDTTGGVLDVKGGVVCLVGAATLTGDMVMEGDGQLQTMGIGRTNSGYWDNNGMSLGGTHGNFTMINNPNPNGPNPALDLNYGTPYGGGMTFPGTDHLTVAGTATLGGTLNINWSAPMLAGSTPGQAFTIISAAAIKGTFAHVNGLIDPVNSNVGLAVVYGSTTVSLVMVSYPGYLPSITGVTGSATTAGGQSVTISGSNFSMVYNGTTYSLISAVDFVDPYGGVVPAESYTLNSNGTITAIAPAAVNTGTYSVVVDTPFGNSGPFTNAVTYMAGPLATITNVSPSQGPVIGATYSPDGTYVTITGSGFTGTTEVDFDPLVVPFGSSPPPYPVYATLKAVEFQVISDTEIIATLPPDPYIPWGWSVVNVTTTSNVADDGTAGPGDQNQSFPGETDPDTFQYAMNPQPTVTGLSQSSSPTGGGTLITITGSNFTNADIVYFASASNDSGYVDAGMFTVSSNGTKITAMIPPSAETGSGDIYVVTDGNVWSGSSSSALFTYTASGSPSVTSLSTNTGSTAGGTTVEITGTNLLGASSVLFGNVPASFTVNSSTLITALAPMQAVGTVNIVITTPSGPSPTVSADQFTYTAQAAPTVSAVGPNTGSTGGGTTVTITGTNFVGTTGVSFGGVPATQFTVTSSSTIEATAPAAAAGTVDVMVTTFGGTSSTSSTDQFTYQLAPAPIVGDVTPGSSQTAGLPITITGSGFTGASAVYFGGVAATSFVVNSDSSITAYAPSESPGTVDVTVTTPSGTSATSSADQFAYEATAAPAVTGLSVDTGSTAGGTVVTISGSGFTSASQVFFGLVPASSFTLNSDGQITAVAPAQTAVTIDVTVVNAGGTSPSNTNDRFSYTPAATPSVTGLSSSGGGSAGGTTLTITGSGFTSATAVNFGGVAAAFTVNSDTSITATVPSAAAGTVNVTVTTPVGTSASGSADQYTYTAAGAPTVTSLGTTTGTTAGDTPVTITGTNFIGVQAVDFGTVACTSFTVNSSTSITAVSPSQAAGTVDVTVATYAGTSATSSADHFTYTAAAVPVVTGVSPNTGSTTTSGQVTLTGSGFTGATAVSFGGVATTLFNVVSDSAITVTPPHLAGLTVNVTVTTPSGTSAYSSAAQFTYVNVTAPAPTVTGVSPNTGSTAGGQVVTVSGTNFSGATAVDFGSTAATSFTINSDSTITAVAPAGTAGTVDITVTTNNGTSAGNPADQFTYLSTPAPAITGVSPNTGTAAGGTSVALTGSGFTTATAVYFGNVAASFVVNSNTSITATAPAQPTGVVNITVVSPSGTSALSSADQYTVTAATLPSVSSLSVNSGGTGGGTSVTIAGSNFTGATGVFFGGVAATSFTVNSATQITALAPPQAVGTVDVTVANYSGSSTTNANDQFSYIAAAAPTVTSISTNSGGTTGGTSVTISGSGFTGASAVYFGSAPASFTVNSDSSITATSPAAAVGTVDIQVWTPTGSSPTSSADQFTFNASAPTVSGVTPSSGTSNGGTSVTITGTNFSGVSGVDFGSVAATFTVVSSTEIMATAPAQAAGTYDITVTTYGGTSGTSAADRFTYTAASAPTVTQVTPSTGTTAGGTRITIVGTGFTGASAVDFGSTAAASFTVVSDSIIVAQVPSGAAGTVNVTVTTSGGTSATSSADHFTYTGVSVPTVTSISPTSGSTAGGTTVTITGTNFTTATGVMFGSVAATSFIIVSPTTITAVAPGQPASTVDITVQNGMASSTLVSGDRFTYNAAAAPTVTSVSPNSGSTAGGTVVTITGTGFTGATGVTFGGVSAASFKVVSATSITATAPSAAAGTVDIVVTTLSGSSATSSSDHFTYTAPPAPTVTGVSPDTGNTAGGAVVTIAGTGFGGATAVYFGGVAAASFTVSGSRLITATAPTEAAGTVDITVTTAGGTSATSSADQFTYSANALPVVASVTPNTGGIVGGTAVTILGSGFTGASAVFFGTAAATSFTVNSDGSITAVAPAEVAGTVDITVTTASGTSATSSADQFTYAAPPPPTVTAVSPSSGTTLGGMSVIITGSNFTGVTGVFFGAHSASSFTVNSSTQITAIAPAETAATVDITVATASGTSATSSADQFTYNAAALPSVSSVTPNQAQTSGGVVVTITGSNFTGVLAVDFGSTAATTWQLVNGSTIIATAPPESISHVYVTVTTYAGTSSTSSANEFYYGLPTIANDNPDMGNPGTQFVLTGTNYVNVSHVSVGQYAATYTVNSSTQITVTAPSGPPQGLFSPVVVTNPAGQSNSVGFYYENGIGGDVIIGGGNGGGGIVGVSGPITTTSAAGRPGSNATGQPATVSSSSTESSTPPTATTMPSTGQASASSNGVTSATKQVSTRGGAASQPVASTTIVTASAASGLANSTATSNTAPVATPEDEAVEALAAGTAAPTAPAGNGSLTVRSATSSASAVDNAGWLPVADSTSATDAASAAATGTYGNVPSQQLAVAQPAIADAEQELSDAYFSSDSVGDATWATI